MPNNETYISVDIETAGPNPGGYAMLSIGACVVDKSSESFYVELKPDKDAVLPEALQVSGLDMDDLRETGLPPERAMQQLADWVAQVTPENSRPVFVAFNAPFDWTFVNDYFHRYLGYNPFGHSALDMKAFYMGQRSVEWGDTGYDKVASYYQFDRPLSHNALQDALDQAELFREMLN